MEDPIRSLGSAAATGDSLDPAAVAQLRWLCSRARGDEALVAGPRAVEAAVLLAREGFSVVVVNPQGRPSAVAARVFEREDPHVRKLLRSVEASAWELPVADGSLDTVLLDDLLPRLAVPDRTVTEAVRILRPDGRLVFTARLEGPVTSSEVQLPLNELLDVVTDQLVVISADIADDYVRIVARPSPTGGDIDEALRMLAEPLTRAVAGLQSGLLLANHAAAREREERDDDRRRVLDLEYELRDARNQSTAAREALNSERRKRAAEDVRTRERITKLERDRARLRYELGLARWKLSSLRTRRWWRLGSVLSEVRRQPSRVLSAPLLLAKVLVTKPEKVPRPEPPLDLARQASDRRAPGEILGPSREVADAPVPRRLMPVATVLGSHANRRFEHEWHDIPLSPSTWQPVLSEDRPDLLFVSSCGLHGADGWLQHVGTTGSVRSPSLPDMTNAFREAGVPTAFWHSGGEPSAPQLEVAELFDVVFCVSEELVTQYRDALAHDRVYLLEYSTQPRLANPVSTGTRRGVLVVRGADEAATDDPTREAAAELGAEVVYLADESVAETSSPRADGMVSSTQVARLAKRFKVVVPPSVTSGSTVATYALLDLAASGRPMVANRSPALTELFGRSVIQAPSTSDALDAIKSFLRSSDLRARSSLQTRRAVLKSWTTSRRVDEVLSRTGVADPIPQPRLTMMIPTNRPQNLRNLLMNVGRQDYPNLDAVLVLHGIDLDEGMVREEAERCGVDRLEVVRVDGSVVLGEVFNRGFAASSGEFVGKMDDDDFYGAAYASDLMACFDPSGADIVGKWTHFAYIEQLDATVLRYARNEHTYQEILAISTLIMKREILEEVSFPPMPSGSGSVFLRAAGAQGAVVYAGDRFNYLYVRSSDGSQHTWPFSEYELAARSDLVCRGRNLDHVVA